MTKVKGELSFRLDPFVLMSALTLPKAKAVNAKVYLDMRALLRSEGG